MSLFVSHFVVLHSFSSNQPANIFVQHSKHMLCTIPVSIKLKFELNFMFVNYLERVFCFFTTSLKRVEFSIINYDL